MLSGSPGRLSQTALPTGIFISPELFGALVLPGSNDRASNLESLLLTTRPKIVRLEQTRILVLSHISLQPD